MNARARSTARRIGRGARVGAGLTVAVAATLALSGAAPAVEPQATESAVRDGSLSAAPEPSASPTPSPSRTRAPRVAVDDEDLLPPDTEDEGTDPRADRSPRAGTSPRSGTSTRPGKSTTKGKSTTGRTPTRGTAQRGSTPKSTTKPSASPTATPAPTSAPTASPSPTTSPTTDPTPTPTVSPTPTPTPTPVPPGPVVLPGGVSGLAFGVCGSLVAEAPSNPTVGRDTLAFAFTAAIPAPAPTAPAPTAPATDAPALTPSGSAATTELPAATPAPTATPTLTPTASDTPTPTPTPTPPPTLLAGQPLTLTTDYRWTLPQHRLRSLLPEQGARVAVSKDGVVVATGYLDDGTGVPRTDQRRVLSNQQLTGTLPLTVCAPDGEPGDVTAGRDLPAGDYEVHAVLDYLGVPFAFPDPLGADPLEGQPAGDLAADPAAWSATLVSTTSVRFTIS